MAVIFFLWHICVMFLQVAPSQFLCVDLHVDFNMAPKRKNACVLLSVKDEVSCVPPCEAGSMPGSSSGVASSPGKRDLEQKLQRLKLNWLAHVDPVKLVTSRAGGQSVDEQITYDLTQLKKDGRLSQKYWENLCKHFSLGQPHENNAAELKVTDKNQLVRTELAKALGLATHKCNRERDVEPLLIYLSQCKDMNQREPCLFFVFFLF